jgi:hypothetical protein
MQPRRYRRLAAASHRLTCPWQFACNYSPPRRFLMSHLRRQAMSGPRRDSSDDTRGGPLHGRGHNSTDHNKKSSRATGKHQFDDNARPPNQ